MSNPLNLSVNTVVGKAEMRFSPLTVRGFFWRYI